jgi:hypothetical protein
VVAQVKALLSDLQPLYCRYKFIGHITSTLLQFVPYSLPSLQKLIYCGIGSF